MMQTNAEMARIYTSKKTESENRVCEPKRS